MFKIGDKIISSGTVDDNTYTVLDIYKGKLLEVNSYFMLKLHYHNSILHLDDNCTIRYNEMENLILTNKYKIYGK
jgi:hypothetical protein